MRIKWNILKYQDELLICLGSLPWEICAIHKEAAKMVFKKSKETDCTIWFYENLF